MCMSIKVSSAFQTSRPFNTDYNSTLVIAEDTIESRVIEIQERKRDLVKQVLPFVLSPILLRSLLLSQAFSGTKAKEAQRTKKEARLQGPHSLFQSCFELAVLSDGLRTQI